MKPFNRTVIFLLTCLCFICCNKICSAKVVANEERCIYLSPNGSDSGNGTREHPFKTFYKAKVSAKAIAGSQPIRVIFSEGEYFLDDGITFERSDSGTKDAPITYEAEEGAKVVISGGKRILKSDFTEITDMDVLSRLPISSRKYVLQCDLKKIGIHKIENIYDDIKEYRDSRCKTPFYYTLSLNDKRQDISQYPNGQLNYEHFTSVISKGYKEISFDKANWGTFGYSGNRPSNWTNAKDAYIVAHTENDFANAIMPVANIDTENRTISTAGGTGQGFTFNNKSKRWKVFNLIEELDIPTEWYIDRDKGMLYYFPKEDFDIDDNLELGVCRNNLITINDGAYITFKGLEFCNGQNCGIWLEGCTDNINIKDCTFNNFALCAVSGLAKTMSGLMGNGGSEKQGSWTYIDGPTNLTIDSCKIYDIGKSAIRLSTGGYITRASSNINITNNYITDTNLLETSMDYVINLYGSGFHVKNNLIHNTNDGAVIGLYDLSETSYNEFYNNGRVGADLADIYHAYGYWHRDNEEAYNMIYDLRPVYDSKIPTTISNGIYNDVAFSSIYAHHNFMENCSRGFCLNQTKFCKIENNVIMNMRNHVWSFSVDAATSPYDAVNSVESLRQAASLAAYAKRYPEFYEVLDKYKYAPCMGEYTDNIAFNCPGGFLQMKEFGDISEGKFENNNLISKDQLSQFVDAEHMDYRLKTGADLLKQYPDALTEDNFDINSIGPNKDLRSEVDRSFSQLYPLKGEKNISAKGCMLIWEMATGADAYKIVIATDPDMKNVVEEAQTDVHFYYPSSVYAGENTYYWTVEAINNRRHFVTKWESTSGIRSFTTVETENIEFDEMEQKLKFAKAGLATIKDGVNYETGTYDLLNSKINKIETAINEARVNSQLDLDYMYYDLCDILEICSYRQILQYKDIDELLNAEWKANIGAKPEFSQNNGIISVRTEIDGPPTALTISGITTANKIPNDNKIYKFKMKVDLSGWSGIAIRCGMPDRMGYGNDCYNFISDANSLQLVKPLKGGGISYIQQPLASNEWQNVVLGAVDTLAGVRVIMMVEDKVVFDYLDTSSYVISSDNAYYFTLYTSSRQCEIQMAKTDYEPEFNKDYTVRDVNAGIFQNWPLKITEDTEQKLSWEFDNMGIYPSNKYYIKKMISDDGDKNAKLTVMFDLDPNANGDEKYRTYDIDFTTGNTGWIEIVATKARRAVFTLESSGNGKLLLDRKNDVKTTGWFGFAYANTVEYMMDDFFDMYTDADVFAGGRGYSISKNSKIKWGTTAQKIGKDFYIPVSVLKSVYGIDYASSNEGKTAEFNYDGISYTFNAGETEYFRGADVNEMKAKPYLTDGTLMLPIEYAAEIIGKRAFVSSSGFAIVSNSIPADYKLNDDYYGVFVKMFSKQ